MSNSQTASGASGPNPRFTISDYYSLEALDAQRDSSRSPPSLSTPPGSSGQSSSPSSTRPTLRTPASFASSSLAGPSRHKPPPTIITSSPPSPSSAPPRRSGNSLEIDIFDDTASLRPSLAPSPEHLGAMAHPLGPGPQPYPSSPEGHTSDTEEYMPELTYPPRGYHSPHVQGRSTPTTNSGLNSGRDLRRETSQSDRALPSIPSSSAAFGNQHYQQYQRRPSDPSTLNGGIVSSHPHHQMLRSPSQSASSLPLGASPSVVSGMNDYSRKSPFEDEEKRLSMEKSMSPPPLAATRALGTHGPEMVSSSRHPLLDEFLPKSWPCRLLLLVVFLQAAIDIAIQANILWRLILEIRAYGKDSHQNIRRLPVYLYIFVSAHIVQFGLTIWAIKTRNTIQVIGLAIFNCLFLIYAGIEIGEVREILGASTAVNGETTNELLTLPINILTAISISIVGASALAVSIITWFIWREFGWDIYRSLGADLRIRKYFFQYQVFETIVCFSFFFFAGFGVQFAILILQSNDPEYVLTWVMFPMLILWLIMGLVSARYEWYIPMSVFLVGLLAGTAYFIFKLIRIWTQGALYKLVQKSLTVFSVLSLIMIVLTLIYGVLVLSNFRRGLRQSLDNRRMERKAKRNPDQVALSSTNSSTNLGANRLVID